MQEINAREFLTEKDLAEHPLWFFDDIEKLIYPVIEKKDFASDPADLWMSANFTTACGLKLKGYIVGFEQVSGLAVIYEGDIFWFDDFEPACLRSIEKLSVKMNRQLKREDFLRLTYEACIDLPWIYKKLNGEFDIYKEKTQTIAPASTCLSKLLVRFEIKTAQIKQKIERYKCIISDFFFSRKAHSLTPSKKNLKFNIFEVVNLHEPHKKHEYLTGKNAVVVSTTMNVDKPESIIYGLYILDKFDQMQFYYAAKDKYLKSLKRSLPYHYVSPVEDFKIENIIILPKANSSIKISPELRRAVRQSLNNTNLITAINKFYRVNVYIKKEISAGETLKLAHGPFVFKHTLRDIDRFETPFSLPRQAYTTLCPDNLVQVEIEFTIKINCGTNQSAIEFRPYYLSMLVDVKNSTIWDARGKPTEPEDYPILK